MKKFSFILLFIAFVSFAVKAQKGISSENKRCNFGITFEISGVPGWGYGEPVILTVEPYSLAAKAGLKVGDIIMEINNTATYLRSNQTISNWLSDDNDSEMKLTVRNIDSYFKEYTIDRQCKSSKSLSEFTLASAYSFYSIEDTSERGFTIPMRVDPNMDVDFSDYHTFDFVIEKNNVPEVDKQISVLIEKDLLAKGLTRDRTDPDFVVQIYYTYTPNAKYDTSINKNRSAKTWRYDSNAQEMVLLPILSGEDLNAEAKGQYILELGIRFFDRKYIDKDKLTQIWDCKTRDFLTDQFDMQEYTRIHAPLMLMQYPYSVPKTKAKYVVNFKKFNYTGLNFSAEDISLITDVDNDSPALLSGIKAGDKIQKIDGVKFNYTISELENGYRRFIMETMKLRDKKTRFVSATGFPDCMYWDKTKYADVLDAFTKESIYVPCFSYLYAFEKYISGNSANNLLVVELKTRKGDKKTVRITPQIQQSVEVRAL